MTDTSCHGKGEIFKQKTPSCYATLRHTEVGVTEEATLLLFQLCTMAHWLELGGRNTFQFLREKVGTQSNTVMFCLSGLLVQDDLLKAFALHKDTESIHSKKPTSKTYS